MSVVHGALFMALASCSSAGCRNAEAMWACMRAGLRDGQAAGRQTTDIEDRAVAIGNHYTAHLVYILLHC